MRLALNFDASLLEAFDVVTGRHQVFRAIDSRMDWRAAIKSKHSLQCNCDTDRGKRPGSVGKLERHTLSAQLAVNYPLDFK